MIPLRRSTQRSGNSQRLIGFPRVRSGPWRRSTGGETRQRQSSAGGLCTTPSRPASRSIDRIPFSPRGAERASPGCRQRWADRRSHESDGRRHDSIDYRGNGRPNLNDRFAPPSTLHARMSLRAVHSTATTCHPPSSKQRSTLPNRPTGLESNSPSLHQTQGGPAESWVGPGRGALSSGRCLEDRERFLSACP